MTLRKNTIDIPLTGGINQGVSSKLLSSPGFLTLQNTRRDKAGKLEKSLGYTKLTQTGTFNGAPAIIRSGGYVNTPVALSAIRDELLLLSTDALYAFSESDSQLYSKGAITATSTELSKISASPVNSSHVQAIVQDNIRVATWLEGTTTYYSVFDQATKTAIVQRGSLQTGSSSVFPRLTSVSGTIYIVWNNSNDLKYLLIPTNAPSTSSTGTLYSTLDSAAGFDISSGGGNLWLAFYTTTAGTIRVSKLSTILTVVATTTITGTSANGPKFINIRYASGGSIDIVWYTGSVINGIRYTTALVVTCATGVLITSGNVTSVMLMDGACLYTESSVAKKVTIDFISTITPLVTTTLMRGVDIVSLPITYNNITYFSVLYESTLQSTYFTITSDGKVVAKWAPGEAGTVATTGRLSNFTVTETAGNTYIWGLLKKGRVRSENATLFADRSPHFASLTFDPSKSFVNTIMHDDLVISGGIASSYDGDSVTEYGFHIYPEGVSLGQASTGGSLSNGTYLVYAIYEWTDNRGIRFQSAPSPSASITLTGGTSTQKITATVPSLRITDKSSNTGLTARAAVLVRVFVTEASGTIPYFSAQANNPDILTTSSVAIDATSVATSTEILYTSGGSLENIAPPPSRFIFTHSNRPILVGLENPDQVAFGKQIRPGEGVGFNEDFTISIDPLGGNLTAGASMDNSMILFKETAIYAINGAGPNDLGEANTFSDPQLISSDVGCIDPKSVLQMPDGIIFKSLKGIYLLTRALKPQYIGGEVQDYNSATILSTNILKDAMEIRFVTDANVTLVYNYEYSEWSVTDTVGALSAAIRADSTYVYLTSLKLLQETSTTYLNDGSYVPTTIRTAWIKLKTLQGYQRIYKMGMLGTYYANHQFSITSYYDYSETKSNTQVIQASSLVNTSLYGDGATYGSDTYYGGSNLDEVYQLRQDCPRQLCEAISFEFNDSIVGSNNGRGFALEGLTITYGVKSGINRMPSSRSI